MLQQIAEWLVFDLFHLVKGTKLADSIVFFLYDSVKILLLLYVMIGIIAILRTYFPLYRLKTWLEGKHTVLAHLIAALFGAVTPFCSCSSVPIFLSMIRVSIPLGVTLSFLVTSPVLNEYLFVLMIGAFGIKIALYYAAGGVIIGTVSGLILGKMKLERYLEKDIVGSEQDLKESDKYANFNDRFKYGLKEAGDIVKKIWKWVLFGVAVGAIIHNYIPQETIQLLIGWGGPFTVVIAVLIGVPMYGSCAAIVPIAVALFDKGVPLGTALAFMMAISALSLPEAIILRRAMNLKLIAIFFGVVTLAIIFTGYLFNLIPIK